MGETTHPTVCSPADVLRRMVCAVALVPIVPAAAITGASWCDTYLKVQAFDGLRWMHLLIPVLAVFCSILIWRSVVIWTLGRKALTALVGMIPFVQVVFAQPLWNAGCVSNDLLRVGQEQVGIGLWIWLTVWVWWGWERLGNIDNQSGLLPGRTRMNRSIRLAVASIGTLPFAAGTFFIAGTAFDDLLNVSTTYVWPLAYLATAMVAVSAWLIIWRRQVNWTSRAAWYTTLAAVLLIDVPIVGTIWHDDFGEVIGYTLLSLPVMGWGVWMASTMWLWPLREPWAALQEDGPACLKCGYLLKGLTKTRCPECGAEPTLDELWAATSADAA